MIAGSFCQDVRVSLRVLLKDKAFCFLAVLARPLHLLRGGGSADRCCCGFLLRSGASSYPRRSSDCAAL